MADTEEQTLESAIACVEDKDKTQAEQIKAWAYLIKTKQAWKQEKWFGRAADTLIQQEIVDKHGDINWGTLEDIEK